LDLLASRPQLAAHRRQSALQPSTRPLALHRRRDVLLRVLAPVVHHVEGALRDGASSHDPLHRSAPADQGEDAGRDRDAGLEEGHHASPEIWWIPGTGTAPSTGASSSARSTAPAGSVTTGRTSVP